MKYRNTPVDPSEIVIGAPISSKAIWQIPDTIRMSRTITQDKEFSTIRDDLLSNVGCWRLVVIYTDLHIARRLANRIHNGSSIWGPKGLYDAAVRSITDGPNNYRYVYAKAIEPT